MILQVNVTRIMIKAEVTLCHLEGQVLEDCVGSPLVYSFQNLATIREEAK